MLSVLIWWLLNRSIFFLVLLVGRFWVTFIVCLISNFSIAQTYWLANANIARFQESCTVAFSLRVQGEFSGAISATRAKLVLGRFTRYVFWFSLLFL